jgi:hypothetical protein
MSVVFVFVVVLVDGVVRSVYMRAAVEFITVRAVT